MLKNIFLNFFGIFLKDSRQKIWRIRQKALYLQRVKVLHTTSLMIFYHNSKF